MYVDIKKAIELVDAAIAERGRDYIYPRPAGSCMYVDLDINREDGIKTYTQVPGCVVGHAFILAGVKMDDIVDSGANDGASVGFLSWLAERGVIDGVSHEASLFFARLQNSQDNRRPWGEARDKAVEGLTWSAVLEEYVPDREIEDLQ